MLCPEEIVIMEVAIPLLSVGLLVTLGALVNEIWLSRAAWRARRQRHQALQEALEVLQAAAAGLLETESCSSGATECWTGLDEPQILTV
ncbi:hypothetical protein [Thermogemmatispora tikiterensis]|uniref:Uncharacterized protein n=1 Tax=Thermogemmatispora tikiterensis TaxID=1825093 RepID=A0A328VJ89_9CHLR|nr:hypothetical protein [Thermogemmatispora tikiterensis]RAQ97968.1 hypothetical protein A4R35_20685 [Thermogemmatispora tikiterensis]